MKCIAKINGNSLKAFITASFELRSNDDGNEKKFAIEKIFNHPDYNGRSLDNDIAVIKLKTKVELKTTTLGTPDKIGTVCLPASGDEVMVEGQQCYITGFLII